MFSILMSAFNASLGFIFRAVIVKFVVFFALYFVATGFIAYVIPILMEQMNISQAQSLFSGLPSMTLFFLSYFKIGALLSAVMSAYATRFVIRRIPYLN